MSFPFVSPWFLFLGVRGSLASLSTWRWLLAPGPLLAHTSPSPAHSVLLPAQPPAKGHFRCFAGAPDSNIVGGWSNQLCSLSENRQACNVPQILGLVRLGLVRFGQIWFPSTRTRRLVVQNKSCRTQVNLQARKSFPTLRTPRE